MMETTEVQTATHHLKGLIPARTAFGLAVATLLLAGSSCLHAVLLAHEPFTNAPGTALIGSADGFGFNGAWQNYSSSQGIATNTATGLGYTDNGGRTLATSGGAGFFQGLTTANSSMQPIRRFNFTRGADGTTTWISFLAVRQGPIVAGTNPHPRGANVPHDLDAGNVQKLALGNSSGAATNTVALIPQGSSTYLVPSTAPFSQTNFIVVRIDHVAGGNDNAYLFVNPELGTEPSTAQADASSLGGFDYSFDRLRVFAGGNDTANGRPYAELILDEYRLGETYADVAPYLSPGSLMITSITAMADQMVLSGIGGSNGASCLLLASPTLAVHSTHWPAVASNVFHADGRFLLTNPLAAGTSEQYYRVLMLPPPIPMIPPSIGQDLADQTVNAGQSVTLQVTASGSPVLNYQWYFNTNTFLTSSTTASYVIPSVQTNQAGTYVVIVTNDYGAATSRVATVTVNPAPPLLPGAYFVSPSGNDSNPGTEASPFLTIAQGLNTITTSGTLYLRGGTYAQPTKLALGRTAVTHGAIRVWAYPGEVPVLNCSGNTGDGVSLSGTGYHLKGLTVMNAGHNGILVSGHSNLVERCVVHDNANTGLHITGGSSGTKFPSYNLILNCDAYLNYDPPDGEDADGFSAKWDLGPGNVFRGCRAWWNSDDGWDLWMGNAAVLIEDCWAFWTATNYWNSPSFNGNGNGFKLGGNYIGAPHRMLRCLAFENKANGIDQNNNLAGLTMDQNTSWNNGTRNFNLRHGTNTTPHVVRNNLSIAGGSSDIFTTGTLATNNSWEVISNPAANADDVISVDSSAAAGPRNVDGSLPLLPFLRPAPSGRLIDQGIPLGEPYSGAAPDLGAFEDGL